MATRYNAKPKSTFGVAPLKGGYSAPEGPDEFSVPPVGLEDADRALFDLFDKEIPLQVESTNGLKKVPIMFAAGERWAMLKKTAPTDKNGSLILPIIVVGRTGIAQVSSDDIAGRGINQQTGEIIIRRRLDGSNPGWQGLINRLFLKNQINVARNENDEHLDDQLLTEREVGDLQHDALVQDGVVFAPHNRKKNIYETIVVPAPQFYTATYEVTIWTQYIQQMNSIIENLISSQLPQGNQWRLDTAKGYWFIATVEGNLYNPQNNFDDMSTDERMVRYQFNIKVPAYILRSAAPGVPVPVRRYVSNPSISFDVSTGTSADASNVDDNPFLGADDPTLPKSNTTNNRLDQRRTGRTRLYPQSSAISDEDPALESYARKRTLPKYSKVTAVDGKGNTVTKYVRVKGTNKFSGETVYAGDTDLSGLSIIVVDD